jgi:hypothetical protein
LSIFDLRKNYYTKVLATYFSKGWLFRRSPNLAASTPMVYLWPANHRNGFKSVVREKHLGEVTIVSIISVFIAVNLHSELGAKLFVLLYQLEII